jgi:hypothetical protein
MEHILKLEGSGLQTLHDIIFPKIADGHTLLFLGAGASVTDKKMFLSKQLMQLYSARTGVKLDTDDIIDFVDTLSADPSMNLHVYNIMPILRRYQRISLTAEDIWK